MDVPAQSDSAWTGLYERVHWFISEVRIPG